MSGDDVRLRFNGVTKTFRRRNRSDSLRDAIPRALGRMIGRAPPPEERFTALDAVDFELRGGEVLGIVGANGAGKSTSLRLAAGIYRPDAGAIEVDGRISALIELSAGFHPDLSGNENIYLVGALLGLKRRDVEAQYDRIAEFADIGDFMDAPVRTYSTGMAVRLGFAVAAHVPAELLLVDEVLAVGDVDFRAKCLRRMSECRQEGVAMLFVSHDLQTVQQFCDRVLFIHHGKVLADGDPREVVAEYRRTLAEEKGGSARTRGLRRGSQQVSLDDVRLPKTIERGADVRIDMTWKTTEPVERPGIGVILHGASGHLVASARAQPVPGAPDVWDGSGEVSIRLPALGLLPGTYDVTVEVRDRTGLDVLDHHGRLYTLDVLGETPPGAAGVVELPAEFRFGLPDRS